MKKKLGTRIKLTKCLSCVVSFLQLPCCEVEFFSCILFVILQACGRIGSFSDGCSAIIITHFTEIYNFLRKNFKSGDVCHVAGVCSGTFHKHRVGLALSLYCRKTFSFVICNLLFALWQKLDGKVNRRPYETPEVSRLFYFYFQVDLYLVPCNLTRGILVTADNITQFRDCMVAVSFLRRTVFCGLHGGDYSPSITFFDMYC